MERQGCRGRPKRWPRPIRNLLAVLSEQIKEPYSRVYYYNVEETKFRREKWW
jgi:hypothetical protein